MLWNSTTWLCICKRVYIGYACCQIRLNINKYVLNFTFTNWLPMDILLPKIWLSKITPPVPSPGKVLDPGMMLNPSPIWDFFFIVPASIKTAYLFSRLAPNIPICNFHSHFRALAIRYPVFWYIRNIEKQAHLPAVKRFFEFHIRSWSLKNKVT